MHQPVEDDAVRAAQLEQIRRDLQNRVNQNNRNRPQQRQVQQQGTSWNFQAGNPPVALPSNPLRLATRLLRPGPTLLVDAYVELLRRTGFALEPATPDLSFSPGIAGSAPSLEDYFPPAPGFPPLGPAQALPPGNFRLVELFYYIEDENVPDSDYLELPEQTFTPRDVRLRAESVSGLNLGSLGGDFVGTRKDRVYVGNPSGIPPGWGGVILSVSRCDYNLLGNQVSLPPGSTPSFGLNKKVRIIQWSEFRIINLPEAQPFIPIVCRGEQMQSCEARVLVPLLKQILNELKTPIKGKDCDDTSDRVFGRGLQGLAKLQQVAVTESCENCLAVPELWENRPADGYPQAAIVFGNKLPNNEVGRERRTLHIPHYRLGRTEKPSIPTYQRGSYWARLILKDNSKIWCYAASEDEAVRVIEALRLYARRDLDPGIPPTTGKVGYTKSSWEAVPLYLQYFSKGKAQQNFDWMVRLR
jgi:hypothetical protein